MRSHHWRCSHQQSNLEVVLLSQPASWSYYILDAHSLLSAPEQGNRDKEDVA